MSTLESAISIAVEAHAGQVDRGFEPYILHPLRVMLACRMPEDRIAAVLHDVAEDNPRWPVQRLANQGFSSDIIVALNALHRRRGIPYQVYIEDMQAYGPAMAQRVKVLDLLDNLAPSRARNISQEHADRYRKALETLRPGAGS